MRKTEYANIGETLYTDELANGLRLCVVPKKGFRSFFAAFAADYGGDCRVFTQALLVRTAALILFVKDDVHPVVDHLALPGLTVAHFFVEVQVSGLLQDGVQTPMPGAVDLFGGSDRGLRISIASVLRHDPEGGRSAFCCRPVCRRSG